MNKKLDNLVENKEGFVCMYDNKMGVKRAYDYKSKYCVVKSFVVFFSGPAGRAKARRLAFT